MAGWATIFREIQHVSPKQNVISEAHAPGNDGTKKAPPPAGGGTLRDIFSRKGKRNRKETAKAIQLVLQDGKSALDPHFTVYQAIAEPIRNLLDLSKDKEQARVYELLDRMGLPKETANKKTGELSGGQQKRVGIARALAVSPRYIVFDESISGLDVILRKSILELLKRVQEEEQCCYLFITHEIDAALYLADEIHVMQNGKLIESRQWNGDLKIFQNPYTKQLLRASHLI